MTILQSSKQNKIDLWNIINNNTKERHIESIELFYSDNTSQITTEEPELLLNLILGLEIVQLSESLSCRAYKRNGAFVYNDEKIEILLERKLEENEIKAFRRTLKNFHSELRISLKNVESLKIKWIY